MPFPNFPGSNPSSTGNNSGNNTPPTSQTPPAGDGNDNPPADPPNQQQQQQTQTQQTQQTPPADPPQGVDLFALLSGRQQQTQQQQQQQTPEQDAQQRAGEFMQRLMNPETRTSDLPAGPTINADRLREMLPSMGLDQGLDYSQLTEALNGENPEQALQGFAQTLQQNTIMALVPLFNELMRSSVEQATEHAVTTSHHNLTSSAIITAFRDKHAYADNPAISPMLTSMANAVAQSAPRNADVGEIVDQLHAMMQQFGGVLTGGSQQPGSRQQGGTQDMTGLFE